MEKLKLTMIAAIACYAILAAGVSSCNVSSVEERTIDDHYEYDGGVWLSMNYKIEERTIDSCEYIIIFGFGRSKYYSQSQLQKPYPHLPLTVRGLKKWRTKQHKSNYGKQN